MFLGQAIFSTLHLSQNTSTLVLSPLYCSSTGPWTFVAMRSGMLFLISISALLTIAQAAASISIWNFDDYNYQRSCVKYALDHVGINVGCDYNECLCRTDITPMATYYLSSQIWAGCSNDKDQTSGVQVYTSYCDVFLGRAEVTTTSQSMSSCL